MPSPRLKSQDVLVCLKLYAVMAAKRTWGYGMMADELGMSMGSVHAAVKRLIEAKCVESDDGVVKLVKRRCMPMLVEAVPLMFFPRKGEITNGIVTGLGAEPLKELALKLGYKPDVLPMVWPSVDGKVRGETLLPLHETVPEAVVKDAGLYELCALVDVVRTGAVSERKAAVAMLDEKLEHRPASHR